MIWEGQAYKIYLLCAARSPFIMAMGWSSMKDGFWLHVVSGGDLYGGGGSNSSDLARQQESSAVQPCGVGDGGGGICFFYFSMGERCPSSPSLLKSEISRAAAAGAERRRSMLERSSRHAGEQSTLMAASINDLPQELLEVVLLHARSSFCLIRAAATCKLWRRVLAAGDFLRRFRRLHPPDVLGHWHYHEGRRRHRPVFFPSPDAPVVDVRGRDSLDFLDHHHYRVSRNMELAFVKDCSTVVVCDPWTRQHRELTPMSPWKGDSNRGFHSKIIIGLAAADDDDAGGGVDMSCFRLLCVSLAMKHYGNTTAWATMYSARGDRWVSLGSRDVGNIMPDGSYWFHACSKFLGRAGGSLCWSDHVSNGVLHLDESSGVFSTFTLPPDARHDHRSSYHRGNLRVVDGGGGGSVRLARILDDDLEVLQWSRDGGHKCMALINPERSWRFLDTAQSVTPGHVVVLPGEDYMWMFDVDVETMVLTRSGKNNSHAHRVFPYHLPWPPTIKVCV
ncbi:hypothetical protein HU200_034479 [Digitaria exilis]|uniref:F-box domain-containing protein n=1 Tax=Digitaria exilis TaxID=1010633 RepID=A0A835BHK8_9POAL|nr:hypothetical protein HU200_034479 [Digitaria exilis]